MTKFSRRDLRVYAWCACKSPLADSVRLFTGLTLAVALCYLPAATAAFRSSTNYQLDQDVISSGSGYSSSANYQQTGIIGQPSPVGTTSSTSYSLRSGFSITTQSGGGPTDTDGDGFPDSSDNCPNTANADQTNTDVALDNNPDHLGDACDTDDDGDGLLDAEEATYGTDPLLPDTDGDGLTDADEINTYGTNPLLADTDGDGISDGAEVTAGRNPMVNEAAVLMIINSILLE